MSRRQVPAVDRLLRGSPDLQERFGRPALTEAFRQLCQELRERLSREEDLPVNEDDLRAEAARRLEGTRQPHLRRVLNATGVVLHTNLGRAPLAEAARQRLHELTAGYCSLEVDLETGERGQRSETVSVLLSRLTGAGAALVVNNCAAAMILIIDTFARDRDVVVSRGELVEIGGSFRIPEVLARAGARLIEVGTTNKTRLQDFAAALQPETGMLLSTHLSNFRMEGFTEAPEPAALAALARERGVLSCLDLGSGLLADLALHERTIPAMVGAGFDLLAFSGDKLLGGPQCGLILGRPDLIETLAGNPLMRALRVDKLTLAALEATLQLYLDPERARQEIPVLSMLTRSADELAAAARRLASRLRKAVGDRAGVELVPGTSSVGGGSLPGEPLPTTLVRVEPTHASEEAWAAALRQGTPAVLVRRHGRALLLDPRTLTDAEGREVAERFATL